MVIRRTSFTEPGETLVVSPSPVQGALRFGSWVDFVGCRNDDAMVNPMAAVPLPVCSPDWGPGHQRWPGTRAQAMWHPLLWLPPRLSGRYALTDEDGNPMIESDDLWAVRVGLELTAAGLYNDIDATWTDVLSLVDIDIDSHAGINRVSEWLAGGSDEVLDVLDLSAVFEQVAQEAGSPDWALDVAMSEMDVLHAVCWASSANALLDHYNDLAEESTDVEAVKKGAEMLASLAGVSFAAVITGVRDGAANEASWWSDLTDRISSFSGSIQELTQGGPVETMVDRLMELHETYWPMMAQLAEQTTG